jgi:hypothetical protein
VKGAVPLAVAAADGRFRMLVEDRGRGHVAAGLAEHGVVEDDRGDALAARRRESALDIVNDGGDGRAPDPARA